MTNKIHKYNFLIVGAGLIGSLLGLHLLQKGYKVLVIDKDISKSKDTRTLAVNANSKDFLINLGLWTKLKSKPQKINKIIIKDYINKDPLIFVNKDEEMGNVIFNNELLSIARRYLKNNKSLLAIPSINLNNIRRNQPIQFDKDKYFFDHVILSVGKKFDNDLLIKKYSMTSTHQAFVGFFKHTYHHEVGRAVLHLGNRRHGADDIESGSRSNLIVWNHNHAYRARGVTAWDRNQEYEVEEGEPSAVCLS